MAEGWSSNNATSPQLSKHYNELINGSIPVFYHHISTHVCFKIYVDLNLVSPASRILWWMLAWLLLQGMPRLWWQYHQAKQDCHRHHSGLCRPGAQLHSSCSPSKQGPPFPLGQRNLGARQSKLQNQTLTSLNTLEHTCNDRPYVLKLEENNSSGVFSNT